MILTEEEARTKWCPWARYTNATHIPGANRWPADPSPDKCRCIASECMAWRWAGFKDESSPRIGRCGAAGKL